MFFTHELLLQSINFICFKFVFRWAGIVPHGCGGVKSFDSSTAVHRKTEGGSQFLTVKSFDTNCQYDLRRWEWVGVSGWIADFLSEKA
jgi:hypothetical protein